MQLSHIKALILDMDGVLWKGDAPIGDLAEIFSRVRAQGLKFVFATNNGTRTVDQYVDRMKGFGVDVEPWQVVTSAHGVAHLVAQKFPRGSKVFVVGEDGVRQALEEKGIEVLPVERAAEGQALVMGIERSITFQKMVEATLLVQNGAPFYATNPDKTFPTPRGEIPGAGAWLSVVITATKVEPIVAGKPSPHLMEIALERLGTTKAETLVVGDRLETDIAAGQAVGCPAALVLSGVSKREEAAAWTPAIDVIATDLSTLVDLLK
ncbi:MAG: HAD-IIA family hydrolase [Chloroflexi bacterium]|nr:HAD-IIA family hydrolase [Chloroflexota bacterium]